MKTPQPHDDHFPGAFTLIELLVVIAVIGLLAAMIFPVGGAMKKTAIKRRVQAELAQVETAIERYKAKYGFYPPDNAGPPPASLVNPVTNQLYFELLGTTRSTNGDYQTLDRSAQITAGQLNAVFVGQVTGFVNTSQDGGGDDGPVANRFLIGLKPAQITSNLFSSSPPPGSGLKLLVCSVQWPENHAYQPVPEYPGVNPWRYVLSSTNRHNLDTYDLWVDILLGKQTNRISNWSRQPQIVSVP